MKLKTALALSTLVLTVVAAISVVQHAIAPLPLGMVSYWKFDEGDGATAYDSVGDNDGTLVNEPEWTTGIVDGGLGFDGIDDYVEISHHPDLNIGGNGKGFTAEAWIKTPTPMGSQQIIRKGFGGVQYEFKTWGYGRLLRLIVYPYGTSYHVLVDAAIIADDGNWHHVAATKSASDNLLRIYFDGELVGTSTSPCPGTEASTAPLLIGTELYPGYWFKGTIDEVAIYNRALTPEEIQQHYQNGLNGLGYETPVQATIDIDPDTLNLKSNGQWITAYIELPEEYSAGEIDVSSILLNGSIGVDLEAPTEVGDHDMDSIPDLMVKFERATIIEWLGTADYGEDTGKSAEVILVITGEAAGTLFEGVDTIRVLLKG